MFLNEVTETIRKAISAGNRKFALLGEPGAGKTFLVRKFYGSALPTSSNVVTSPTFLFRNVYPFNGAEIHHYDLYRVRSHEHLIEIGFYESADDPSVICFIEWADLYPEALETCQTIIEIETGEDAGGKYKINIPARK